MARALLNWAAMPSPATSKAAAAAFTPPPTYPLHSVWLGLRSFATTLLGLGSLPASADIESAPEDGRAAPGAGTRAATTPPFAAQYFERLETVWRDHDWSDVELLIEALRRCWREGRQVFLCGNGGSAANAIHLANDLLYGVGKDCGRGMRVTALPANAAVITCLANDISYEDVFAQQLTALGHADDVLIAFSGSGNSPNILRVLDRAHELGIASFAVLGFSGGRAKKLADHAIHFPVDDMQVSEDLQMMVGHMVSQELARTGP
jgi:D-sedoheptulose 7-phosphate isomerase